MNLLAARNAALQEKRKTTEAATAVSVNSARCLIRFAANAEPIRKCLSNLRKANLFIAASAFNRIKVTKNGKEACGSLFCFIDL